MNNQKPLEGDIIEDGKERYIRVKLSTMQANAKVASDAQALIRKLTDENQRLKVFINGMMQGVLNVEIPQEELPSV